MTCCQSNCMKPATFTVYWPEHQMVMCVDHAMKAQRVGQALGCVIVVRRLDVLADHVPEEP
jgi:hypothetical protein